MFIEKADVKLLSYTPDPERVITAAAKLCYSNSTPSELFKKQTDESIEKFINMIMGLGHGSILEHVSFTFAIEDISRVTEVQLVRHRTASPSIQSGRYVKRNPNFFIPEAIKNDKIASEMYIYNCERATQTYLDLIDRLERILVAEKLNISIQETYTLESEDTISVYEKTRRSIEKIALEDARYALPQSLRTHGVYSIDLRNLIHFISKRKCKRAQKEIRMVANQMYELIKPLLPNIIKYIGAPCEMGSCQEGSMCCGKPYDKKR